jgi:hypothetical protein
MDPVKLTKAERLKKREEFLEVWRAMPQEAKDTFIEENKKRHTEAFQQKKQKLDEEAGYEKEGISLLTEANAFVFTKECPVYHVERPVQRSRKGYISAPARLREDRDAEFGVMLAVVPAAHPKTRGMQRLEVTFMIRSPKDTDNRRKAKGILGHRIHEEDYTFRFEFNVPLSMMAASERNTLRDICWEEFNAHVRSPHSKLPYKFARSWLAELEVCNYY